MSPGKTLLLKTATFLSVCLCVPCGSYAQGGRNIMPTPGVPGGTSSEVSASLIVMVNDAAGGPVDSAIASLNMQEGGVFAQTSTTEGRAEFDGLKPGDYTLTVSAAGYRTVTETLNVIYQGTISYIVLHPTGSDSNDAKGGGPPVLAPKARKELTKAIDALRAQKPDEAREPLDRALHLAPTHPDVEYFYGVYFMELHDWPQAMTHWEKALSLYPKHYGSLVYMGEGMLVQKKPEEAVAYLNRAVAEAPAAWRPHAMLAQAALAQHKNDEAVQEADKAIKLGHDDAVGVEPLLADALVAQGNRDRAIAVLEHYVQKNPKDERARKNLEVLRGTGAQPPAPANPEKKSPPASPGGSPQP